MELDATDVQILDALQQDGRRSFTGIARDLGISEGTVRHRVNRLLRQRAVQIVAVADPLEVGFGLMASVAIKTAGGAAEEVARRVAELPEADYVVLCAGKSDLIVEIICRDTDHLQGVLYRGIAGTPGVASYETSIYLRIVKESYQFPDLVPRDRPGQHAPAGRGGGREKVTTLRGRGKS